MEVLCRTQSSRAALCSVVLLFVAEAALVAKKTLLSLLLAIGSVSSQTGQLVEGPDAIHRLLQKSKHESVPENKDDGESDEDDDEDDDDQDGEDQEDDGGEGDPSGDENDNEGDEKDDPEANGEGGSEEDDDDNDDDDDDDDEEQEEDDEDEEDDEEDEELPQPPAKKRK
ncbi:glutamic acid-rich protein-like [Zingiber officinale]|uniref:glutamic acid-rich protein-like n=1 Tax=Zingiber officinale TaxID=94328 RepID=UPI001C4C3ADC|nr:glutamic acid-rich protein-like [Zingiber officinale]XP_042458915.1 glutamic acid-rich protein-like [Zingiber officinale]XP_042458916.1 glutamic acid-rich protein-like [Zingiber officinale]